MRTNVRRADLLAILKNNREAHRGLFEKAFAKFSEMALEELTKNLETAKRGGPLVLIVNLQQPQDMTDHYDRVIKMVELTTDEEIELNEQEAAQYLMDDWQWKRQWTTSNTAYLVSS